MLRNFVFVIALGFYSLKFAVTNWKHILTLTVIMAFGVFVKTTSFAFKLAFSKAD